MFMAACSTEKQELMPRLKGPHGRGARGIGGGAREGGGGAELTAPNRGARGASVQLS